MNPTILQTRDQLIQSLVPVYYLTDTLNEKNYKTHAEKLRSIILVLNLVGEKTLGF